MTCETIPVRTTNRAGIRAIIKYAHRKRNHLLHRNRCNSLPHAEMGRLMHDNTPGGIATKERAIAYWTDPNNFPTYLTPNDIAFQNIIRDL